MVTTHAYPNSREAVLPVWTGEAQARRQAPDASLTALFVHIHGMLFTNIQLDDFRSVLDRFEEKLYMEGRSRNSRMELRPYLCIWDCHPSLSRVVTLGANPIDQNSGGVSWECILLLVIDTLHHLQKAPLCRNATG